MTIQPTIGAPDWQRGIISAGKLLATAPANAASVNVDVSQNMRVLKIFVLDYIDASTFTVTGATSGVKYPLVSVNVPHSNYQYPAYAAMIAPEIDTTYSITPEVAMTSPWYVVGDNSNVIVTDSSVAGSVSHVGYTASSTGMVVMFQNAIGYAQQPLVDASGRVVMAGPDTSTNVLMASGTETLLPAPSSGAYYLNRYEVFPNGVYTSGEVTLRYASGDLISGVADPGTGPCGVDLHGYRVATGVQCTSSVLNKIIVLRYSLGV